MKKHINRLTASEKFNQLTSPPPGASPAPRKLAPLGISQLLRLGKLSARGSSTVTMKDLGDHFLATMSGPNYDHKVNVIVKELGPTTIVEDLTPTQLRAWFYQMPRAASTRNHYLEFFATMIKAGLRDGLIHSNPLGGGLKQHLHIRIKSTEADILTVDQVARLMDEAKKRTEALHVLALIFFGGLDVSQACGLYYSDVTTSIHVAGYLTLNGHPWTLPCPDNLPAWLNSEGPKTGRITQLSGNSMGRILKKIFRKLGIPRPADIGYTWAAYRRAVLGDIEKVYAGRYLTGTKTQESRVPVVSRAQGELYFSLVPPPAVTATSTLTLLPPPNPQP